MSKSCVNRKDNLFISMAKEYDVSTSTLENIIHAWEKSSGNLEYESEEFKTYLNSRLKRGTTLYNSKAKYTKAHKVWEEITKKFASFSEDQIKNVKSTVNLLFEEGNYSIYETNTSGVYTLKVNEPIYNEKLSKREDNSKILNSTLADSLSSNDIDLNAPIYKYTHLWASKMMENNPKMWRDIVEAMKLSPIWNTVMADASNSAFNDDSSIAIEVLARISSNKEYSSIINQDAESSKVENLSTLSKIKKAIENFWSWVQRNVFHSEQMNWQDFVENVVGDFYGTTKVQRLQKKIGTLTTDILNSIFKKTDIEIRLSEPVSIEQVAVASDIAVSEDTTTEEGDAVENKKEENKQQQEQPRQRNANRELYKKAFKKGGEKAYDLLYELHGGIISAYPNEFLNYLKDTIGIPEDIASVVEKAHDYLIYDFTRKNKKLFGETNEDVHIEEVHSLLATKGYSLLEHTIDNGKALGVKMMYRDKFIPSGKTDTSYTPEGYHGRSVICYYNHPEARLANQYVFTVTKNNATETPTAYELAANPSLITPEWETYLESVGRKNEDGTFNFNKLEPNFSDPFSLSHLMIRIGKRGVHDVEIISRYNHGAFDSTGEYQMISGQPNATLGNDLNKLVDGLFQSLMEYKNIDPAEAAVATGEDIKVANDDKIYIYNQELNGVYFGNNFWIDRENNAHVIDRNKERLFGTTLVTKDKIEDLSNPFDLNIRDIYKVSFTKDGVEFYEDAETVTEELEVVIKGEKKTITKEVLKGYVKTTFKNGVLETETSNSKNMDEYIGLFRPIELVANNITEVNEYFLNSNTSIEKITMNNLKNILNNFLQYNKQIKVLNLPNVESVGDYFVRNASSDVIINMPNLKKVGHTFMAFYNSKEGSNPVDLYLPNLESTGNYFMQLANLGKVNLPNLEVVGHGFLMQAGTKAEINLPKLTKYGSDFLGGGWGVKSLNAPMLTNIEGDFMYANMNIRRQIEEQINVNNEIQKILKSAPRDSQGRLLAPNNEPSNLDERQYAHVRTKAFIDWFGDWINDPKNASKVVDENGEPLVVYHGSPSTDISSFRLDGAKGFTINGSNTLNIPNTAWFSADRTIAEKTYSILSESLEEREPRYGKVYPVFLNIRTPLVDSLKGAKEEQDFISNYVVSEETAEDFYKRVSERIVNEDKDGFILTFEDTNLYSPSGTSLQTQYGVTSDLQIKSADANRGTYYTKESNIYRENIEDGNNLGIDSNLTSLFNKYRSGATSYVPIKDIITLLSDSEYSSIIELLNTRFGKDIFKGVNVQVVSPLNGFSGAKDIRDKFGNRRAFYDAASKTIYINSDAEYSNSNSSAVLLHELMHALTVDKILSNPKSRQAFESILDDYLEKFPDSRYSRTSYSSKDSYLEEFIANIWSDPTTIENLKKIKSTRVNKSLWEEIKDFFVNLFSGIFSGTTKDSLMAEASTELIKLLESPSTVRDTKVYRESISKGAKTLAESRKLVESIISSSRERIKFDSKTHTYYVDGVKADTSVTQYIHGNKDLGDWALPSSLLGTTVDTVTRDFFSSKMKSSYPNLTNNQKNTLVSDLRKFKKQLDNRFGKGNYEVVTIEFPIATKYTVTEKNGKKSTKIMAGTLDMLVYDNEGNFYIYDMKTSRSGINEGRKVEYSKQLSLYKSILETNYPQLKDKIKELNLIEFSVHYPNPNEATYYNYNEVEEGKEGQLYISTEDNSVIDIQDSIEYQAPRFKFIVPIGESKMSELKFLGINDKTIIEEEVGTSPVPKDNYTPDKSIMQRLSWDNNPLLTATEKRFLSNQLMKLTSFIISHLQSSTEANKHYFGNAFSSYDFTTMSRYDIIKTVSVGSIFNYIKEEFYNPENRLDIEDLDNLDKLQVAYDNFEAMARQGYSKLISLEDVTVVHSRPEFIKRDDIEENIGEDLEQGSLEEKEREYWQIGQRQLSAKSSLSSTIRRLFERLPVVDQNGNSIKDEYGFNMDTFVDADTAINSILTWVNAATTIEEMETILSNMTTSNPWLNNILEAIKEEPVRSQFFQNFRKDFLTYSVVRIEYDSKGNRNYVTDIINTQGAAKTILNNAIASFKLGLMTDLIIPIRGDLEGRGRVNTESVNKLKETVSKIVKKVQASFESTNRNSINSSINTLAEVLSKVGLPITPTILKSAFSSDAKSKNYSNTKIGKVLTPLTYLLDTILDNKDNTSYNPMMKGSDGNIYSNYKNIVNILSPYIQDSVESSTYENGKMYYSFTTPSYMGKLIGKLSNKLGDNAKFKKFIDDEYGSYKWFKQANEWNCPWLDRIVSSETLRQGLQHKVQLSFDKTNYTDLSELSYTLSLIHEYFYDKNKKWAWYRLPILANKPSSEFVRFERLSGRNYKTTIKRGLRKVFNQEIMRMRTVLERADNPNIEKIGAKGKIWFDIESIDPKIAAKFSKGKLTLDDLVKDGKYIFSGSGAEFKFLSPLNLHIINKTNLGQMIVDKLNNKNVNEETLDTLFNQAVDVFMSHQMKIERYNWEKMGLFETEEVTRKVDGQDITKKKYKYVAQLGNSLEEINSNLEEYVWNDMFATINIIELTATDLAYYKNVEDFQKRYSQVHAPSMKLNITAKDTNDIRYSADGLERTIYLKDDILKKSDIIRNVKKVFDDKISTLKGVYKEDMQKMKTLILQAFENINVADAQGYSSPTSYRKKMGMQGKWTSEMEEAYAQIREGNLNINNLGVIWQPLKPFVYSQVRKTSGATTMSEIKVPVQNKNSEYLLIIADAIMRSGKQTNKLQAIFDFMEDSAYDNGIYNGKGIDTVQFISAVNSGGMGAIDISGEKSYKQVIQILENAAYYHKDRSSSTDNDNDRYDEQYVHTISYEDYGIQQEVPAHMADHFQAMGSQVRILSVSDISADAEFIIGNAKYNRDKLHKEYFDLLAENIKDSFEKLKKDLALSKSPKEQNKKLSDLLQETILKDQRYGSDLLRACGLDENGEFIVPLSDPIQSTRIQQLLNSIIKSRINKQKVQGGPAVQVSAFGLSDDLNIIWQDEDGNLSNSKKFNINKQKSVAYFECYAPIPSKDMEVALLKPDGSYMTPQEAVENGIINEEMLKAIAYRIPTEDKYSMLPIKIKGFVPKAAGEAVILPKEITTLTGSDFDIDKMYIMFKEFVRKEKVNYKLLKQDMLKSIPYKGDKKKEAIDKLKIVIDEIENGNISFTEGSFEMEVWEYLHNDDGTVKDRYISRTFTERGISKRGKRNNKIFDIQWAVLTNKDTAVKMFNPGSFDIQKKTARIVNILKANIGYTYEELSNKKLEELDKILETSSHLNIVFPSTQVYFHKQNMTAGKLIGIFANNNTSHAFLSMQDIHFNISDEAAFTFNNVTVDNNHNNKVDAILAKDGALISKTIAGFLAASVDAVKDPVLNYMNLNTMTAGPAMVLARLGFDSDSIGLFLTQPIIEKVTGEYFKRNNEGYAPIEDVIDDELESSNTNYTALDKDLINTGFTKEELAKGISKGDATTEFQIRSLLLLQRLVEMGKDLNTLTFLTKFNSVTNAVGPTIADTLVMRERYNKFLDEMNSKEPPFNSSAKNIIDNNAMLSAFYESTVGDRGASTAIFSRHFPHYSGAFTTVLGLLRETTKGNIDSKTINKLVNDFILYKLTIGDNPVLDASLENRSRYIHSFVKEFTEKTKDIVGNDFISTINIKPKNVNCPVDTLESKTGGYSIDVQERIKDGWGDLLSNSETASLGLDLFFYNLFRSGFNYSPKTSGHLASVDVRRSVPGYTEALSNPEFEDDLVIAEEFLNQFRRNHTQDNKIVPTLKPHNKVSVKKEKNIKKENTITFKFEGKKKVGIRPIIIRESAKEVVWAPVIIYDDKVYMSPVSTDTSVTYTETTTLGNANNFLEYNYNEGSTMKSAITNLPVSMEKEDSNAPINSSIQAERKPIKSVSSKELSAAIDTVFNTKEAEDIAKKIDNKEASKEEFTEYVTNKVVDIIGVEWIRPTVLKKVKDIVKHFCK